MSWTRRAALGAAGAVLWSGPGSAQADPMQLLWREGRYLPLLQAGAPLQLEATASFVGDEARALADAARDSPEALTVDAQAEDAIARIVREAAGRRVVVLNEAHTASRHRAFLARVLRALRPEGFTHFAAETFGPDVAAHRRGRSMLPLGTYSLDPVFAEAVRESVEAGWKLVPYEQTEQQALPPATEAHRLRMARREEAQAVNFMEGALADPASRVLVYVGYAHLRETPDRWGNSWFARRLRAFTGIDPLTIAQAETGSFGPYAPDSSLARAVLERFAPTAPIVVQGEGGVVGAADAGADLAVFHPNLPDVDGRPGWLAADPARRRVRVRLPAHDRKGGPALAQALPADEPEATVPADQYLLPEGATEAVFRLRPGRYRTRVETLDGFDRGEVVVAG